MKPIVKAVTIDQLDIKDHVRWAQDQESYDVSLLKESQLVASHPEILGTSVIYPSKFEELFELQKINLSWASFSPPKNFHMFSKRFFSYRIFPHIDFEEELRNKTDENEIDANYGLIQEIHALAKTKEQHLPSFENDKSTILHLLESIKWLNQLLKQINARKLQYQKG